MLANFCKALEINGAHTKVKRFILVTGAKNYGVHLGAVKIPMQETDPWYVPSLIHWFSHFEVLTVSSTGFRSLPSPRTSTTVSNAFFTSTVRSIALSG